MPTAPTTALAPQAPPETLLGLYRTMQLIRRCEEELARAHQRGLMGTSGIVGPCILQAAGAGYSAKLKGSDGVAVAFFGDGAVNNGAFHEGLNLASIWKLPVLFVCENNQFATEVPFVYAAGNPRVADRGAVYGLPALEVDGNGVLAVFEAAKEAVNRARA